MILVDTSVWVDHLRKGVPLLSDLLNAGEVAIHPFVVGELACGHLRNRASLLSLLQRLPRVAVATHEEAMYVVDTHALQSAGIGWIDVHLLASALLSRTPIWTRDKTLQETAERLKIAGKA